MAGAKLKKVGILVFTMLLGAVVGFGTSYTQTPLWQSSAQFESPKVLELGNYFSLFSTYQFLNGNQAQQLRSGFIAFANAHTRQIPKPVQTARSKENVI